MHKSCKRNAPPKKHHQKSGNPEIKKLSEEQKKIRNKIDSIKDPEMIRKARNERNKIMRKIHKEIDKKLQQTTKNTFGPGTHLIVDVNNYIMAIHNCCELYP